MSVWKKILVAASLTMLSASLQAQAGDDELEAQMQAAEAQLRASEEQMREMEKAARLAEREAQMQIRLMEDGATVAERKAEIQVRLEEVEHLRESEAEEVEARMREAERRLAEAAQQIAELSRSQLPRVAEIERRIFIDGRPVLGVTISRDGTRGPVEGVTITGATPGGAAAEAGLRAGDVITAVNGHSLAEEIETDAAASLLDFMADVEDGDLLEIEYLRNGKVASVEVRPRSKSGFAMAFGDGDSEGEFEFHMPPMATGPDGDPGLYRWYSHGSSWGEIELVTLTEGLGRYFGTSEGLLVVRAPQNDELRLQDGDVIQSIDGRVPGDVSHAMRILSSYQSGEKLDIVIVRDMKKRTIKIEMPDHRQGRGWDFSMPESEPASTGIPLRLERRMIQRT